MHANENYVESKLGGITIDFELIDDNYEPTCNKGDIKAEKVITLVKIADEKFDTDPVGALSEGVRASFEAIGNLEIVDASIIVGKYTKGLVNNFINGFPKMSSLQALLDVDVTLYFRCCVCNSNKKMQWGELREHTVELDQANTRSKESMQGFRNNFSQVPIQLRKFAENACK